jgi:hypothetical protein
MALFDDWWKGSQEEDGQDLYLKFRREPGWPDRNAKADIFNPAMRNSLVWSVAVSTRSEKGNLKLVPVNRGTVSAAFNINREASHESSS